MMAGRGVQMEARALGEAAGRSGGQARHPAGSLPGAAAAGLCDSHLSGGEAATEQGTHVPHRDRAP